MLRLEGPLRPAAEDFPYAVDLYLVFRLAHEVSVPRGGSLSHIASKFRSDIHRRKGA